MKRLWHQCHTALSRATKVVVLSLVVLASFFSGVVPAQAQTAINYAEYANLFKGTNPPASLTPYSLFKTKNGTTTPDVKFNLQMSFAGISRDNAGDDKEAAWAKIRDFNDSAYVFLLRICDVNDPTETRCLFARIPHKRVPLSPPPTNQQTPEIYHYQYTNVFSSDLQNDKFNVLFPVTTLIGVNPQGLIVQNPVSDFVFIGNTTTYKADAWYCAQGNNIPTQNDPSNPNYRMFNDICGNGKPYFKIATSATFRMPQSAAEAQSQVPGTITPVDTTPTQSNVPSCGFIDGSILGCIAQVAYYLIYRPIAWFAGLMGNLFDFFLGYSLSDASYRAEFAVRGWQIVRDICNIFFVIILVWVGLMTVFKTSSYNPKKVLATLVINALLINFSLFVTRVVIDVSNITARVFYHSVEVCDGPCQKDAQGVIQNTKPGIGGYTPLSEKIVSAFNPQKIFSMNVLSASSMLPDNGTTAQGGAKTLSVGDSEYAGYYLVVSLIAALILFAIAMMFWKTAFFFLGRVIGLYMAMIFSPFAFLARDGVPIVGNIKKLSWNSWLGDLTKYATLAPIFVFFLYVIYSFLETDFLKVYQEKIGTNFFETVVYIAIPMLIVYFMINQGVKIAEEYAGDFGKQVQGFAQKATGIVAGGALGVATGGAAFLGRNTVGRGIRAITTKTDLGKKWQNWAASNADKNLFAKLNNKFINRTQTGSFDARNLGIKVAGKEYTFGATLNKSTDQLGKKMGVTFKDTISKNIGLGQDKALGKGGKAGGVKKLAEEREKKLSERIIKNINYSHLSDSQAKEVWEEKKAAAIKKYAEEKSGTAFKTSIEIKNAETVFKNAEAALDKAKKTGTTYEQSLAQNTYNNALSKLNDEKKKVIETLGAEEKKRLDVYGNIKSVKGLEAAMRAEYAQDLRNNSFWMKNGELRYSPAAMQSVVGAALAVALPGIGTALGGAALIAAIDGAINNNKLGSVVDRATNKIISDAKKSQGRGNAERQLSDKIDELKKKVIDAAKKYGGQSDKFDDYEIAELEDAILKRGVDIDEEILATKDKYEKRRLQKLKKDLDSALEEIEKKQEKLDKMKSDKEKKDGVGDDKGKPKDGDKK